MRVKLYCILNLEEECITGSKTGHSRISSIREADYAFNFSHRRITHAYSSIATLNKDFKDSKESMAVHFEIRCFLHFSDKYVNSWCFTRKMSLFTLQITWL